MNGIEDLRGARLRQLLDRVASLSAAHLDAVGGKPIVPPGTGEELERLFDGPVPEEGLGEAALDALEEVVHRSRAQNGGFFGYVFGSGEPVAAAADLLASAINQNVTAWRSGPAAVTIEKTVIRWLAAALGCEGFTGSLTGGGSMANLIGLTLAREARAPANVSGATPAVVYASEEVHVSISKAVALLGLGNANLRRIPTDDRQRMRPDALAEAMEADVRAGKRPLAVVVTCGTVATGAIDPLEPLAAIARRHGAWVHVDGAYGALAALAVPERFGALAAADSLSLDGHKWLYQPVDCGVVLFRDAAAARAAFSTSADYARPASADPIEGYAFFDETLELSRRFRALKLWLSLRFHGLAAFRGSIRADLAHAEGLARLVEADRDLELLSRGDLSVVCFRHRTADNEALLARVNARGRVYLSNATVGGRFALRACFVNHRTTDADVRAVIDEVHAAA